MNRKLDEVWDGILRMEAVTLQQRRQSLLAFSAIHQQPVDQEKMARLQVAIACQSGPVAVDTAPNVGGRGQQRSASTQSGRDLIRAHQPIEASTLSEPVG